MTSIKKIHESQKEKVNRLLNKIHAVNEHIQKVNPTGESAIIRAQNISELISANLNLIANENYTLSKKQMFEFNRMWIELIKKYPNL